MSANEQLAIRADDPLLTLAEVATLLRKSEAQLRWMIHQGTAPKSGKIGGRRVFQTSTVNAFINAVFEKEG